jgi:DNA primase large subunit
LERYKKTRTDEKRKFEEKYGGKWESKGDGKKKGEYQEIEIKDVKDDMFPPAIKKLLLGVEDGKKRGLFILLTFFKSINLMPEDINNRAREWNKLNRPPLKEGYVKAQIDWHLRQKKKILPPNYDKPYYKDIGISPDEEELRFKNPVSYAVRKSRKMRK